MNAFEFILRLTAILGTFIIVYLAMTKSNISEIRFKVGVINIMCCLKFRKHK